MSSILLLAHPVSCTQDQFNESLKDLVDSRNASSDLPSILPDLDASKVKQCVVGPNHLAFLMQDGQLCRVSFHINSEGRKCSTVKDSNSDEDIPLTSALKKTAVTTAMSSTAETSSQNEHTFTLSGDALNSISGTLGRWTTHRVTAPTSSNATSSAVGNALASRAAVTRGRGRIIRATRGRAGSGWLSNRAVIPASAVPEELISQAQVVLQGKSRQVIIKELQKTSLDVNLAVNNLLSRDDDDPDDQDEDAYLQETYIPSEDLMSIFEAGIPGDEPFVVQRDAIFSEDIIYNPSYSRAESRLSTSRPTTQNDSSSGDRDKDLSSSRIRDKWWGMLMMEGKEKSHNVPSPSKLKTSKAADTTHRFGEIQWWRCEQENDDTFQFVEIAALHSELVAVSEGGYLHSWKWNDPDSPPVKNNEHSHPRVENMKITNKDKISKIAACSIRISVVTETGKLATWLDDTLSAVGHRLELPLQTFSEFKGQQITRLHACNLYSCVQLSSGSLYWWGVFPYEQRKKILDKVKTKAKKSAIAGSSQIRPGTLVCIRSCPLYYPGAVGFTTINGEPRVGRLIDKAWSINEKCRFKIMEPNKSVFDVKPDVRETDIKEEGTLLTRKRKYSDEELCSDCSKEEEWCLQDVIFVEEVRNVPVGEVLKVDGAYAMVHFSSHTKDDDDSNVDVDKMLRESVIRRKDELQIVKWTTPPKMPDCYQKTPKQLVVSAGLKVITLSLDKRGVHALLKSSSGLRYSMFSLASGRPEPGGNIQMEPALFLSRTTPFTSALLPSGVDSIVLMQDPNGCLYPLIKDNVGGIQNPSWANLSSLTCFASGNKKTETSLLGISILVMKENELIQNILRCDAEAVQQYLARLKDSPDLTQSTVSSKCDGNQNFIHVCVSTCQPVASKSFKLPSASVINRPADRTDELKDEPYEPTMWVPLFDGLACLDVLLKSDALKGQLFQLLSQKDALGYTPFMTAVRIRAYPAALKLYDTIVNISESPSGQNMDQFIAMICPIGTDPDMSPLQMLCCNDTCSFTWTGTKHINQDIFECKTCGLVGPLCCCTECAQVCHIGHECKLKRTSPTAYCDCWEKCACKSLIGGDHSHRVKLLHRLVDETDLSTKPNKKGQHILLFLARTVARQANEQVQYMPNKTGDSSKQRSNNAIRSKTRSQTPPSDHELEPPKFAKLSLAYILKDWQALSSMILFGCSQNGFRRSNVLDDHVISASMLQPEEIGKYLNTQNGTSLLDNFVHKILVKCNSEFLELLIDTLLKRMGEAKSTGEYEDVLMVTQRFIRAVIRVFVILSSCTGSTATKKRGLSTAISQCKRVFLSLNVLAAQEMSHIAATIFAPVRMGVVYPSSPFSLGTMPDSSAVSDELFSILPFPERSSVPYSHSTRVRFADTPTVEEGHVEEEEDLDSEPASQSQLSVTDESHEDTQNQQLDMEIDLLAESDSESDESNNGDTNNPQINNTTSNTGGSVRPQRTPNADDYYSTAETSDGDEDIEDDDDDDDDDEDDDNDEHTTAATEQRNAFGGGDGNAAPHALQWAVRNHQNVQPTANTTAAAHVSGSGMVFIDTAQLRRSGASASNEGAATNAKFCAPSALARTFTILIREVSDLLSLTDYCCKLSGACLPIEDTSTRKSRDITDKYLESTWKWLWKVMDTTEAQLRFGASLTAVSDPNHPQHPLFDSQSKSKSSRSTNSTNILRSWGENRRKKRGAGSGTGTTSDIPNARQEYLTYILSLMRSHHSEHGDSLPKVEITSLRHVAYILDAFIYYLRSNQTTDSSSLSLLVSDAKNKSTKKSESSKEIVTGQSSLFKSEPENEDEEESEMNEELSNADGDVKTLRHRFFKRSDSTLVLGYESTDPVSTPLKDALPLADRPHLLHPSARRDQLFGVVNTTDNETCPDSPICMNFDETMSVVKNDSYLKLSPNVYLGRWHICLELFGRVFLDDVGSEPYSVLNELGRFDVKETKFRREMEKLRNSHQKDLYLEVLDRSRPLLLLQSIRQLNSQFGRRVPGAGPLNIHRLKVSFKDEPGEGSGVVRSFYTAISNAFLADENLPNLESIFSGSRGLTHQLRVRAKERERERRRSSAGSLPSGMIPRIVRRNERSTEHTASEIEACNLSIEAPPYNMNLELDDSTGDDDFVENPIPIHKRELGRRLYKKVVTTHAEHANKVTGMLLELTPTQLIYLLTHDDTFKEKVNEAIDILTAQTRQDSCLNIAKDKASLDEEEEEDNSALFFQPGKPGYYSPRPGKNSPERLNCMRNVGRIIGLCLLQNEICPLSFNRHVIKYLLGRKISWHDLAFFDPTLYESLRQLLEDSKKENSTDIFLSLDLTYLIQLRHEEGGDSVELIKGGAQVEVAPDNVHDYVKKYAEYRMVTNSRRALQAIRRGVLDVVPAVNLVGLTAEDFRLLLNGAGDINVQQLLSYTFFSDETGGEGQDKLTKFKKWFWSVVENMTPKQKQDLLYFWTSSPAMPSSAEGFQPMPSVTVKPANDHQLPTANTCISRLYVPLYSSKSILRSKFLLAIKTKVFGFV